MLRTSAVFLQKEWAGAEGMISRPSQRATLCLIAARESSDRETGSSVYGQTSRPQSIVTAITHKRGVISSTAKQSMA